MWTLFVVADDHPAHPHCLIFTHRHRSSTPASRWASSSWWEPDRRSCHRKMNCNLGPILQNFFCRNRKFPHKNELLWWGSLIIQLSEFANFIKPIFEEALLGFLTALDDMVGLGSGQRTCQIVRWYHFESLWTNLFASFYNLFGYV